MYCNDFQCKMNKVGAAELNWLRWIISNLQWLLFSYIKIILFLIQILKYHTLKAPICFKLNQRTNWYYIISNKIRPKRSLFWVRFSSLKQLTKANFLGEFVLAPKHLWATIGPWRLRNRWVCSGTPPSLCDFFFSPPPPSSFLIQQRSGRRTTSPSH